MNVFLQRIGSQLVSLRSARDAIPALRWLPISVFFLVGLVQIDSPGMQMDEVNHAAFAPAIIHDYARDKSHFRLPDNILGDQSRFPILGGSVYNSVLEAYVGAPFFEFFGYSTTTFRLFHLFLGGIIVLLVQKVASRAFSVSTSIAISSALALDPVFIYGLRFTSTGPLWTTIPFLGLLAIGYSTTRIGSRIRSLFSGILSATGPAIYFVALPCVALSALISLSEAVRRRRATWFIGGALLILLPYLYAIISIAIQSPSSLTHLGMPDFALAKQATMQPSVVSYMSASALEFWNLLTTDAFHRFTGARGVPYAFLRGIILLSLLLLATVTVFAPPSADTRNGASSLHLFSYSIWPICALVGLGAFLPSISYHHLAALLPFIYLSLGIVLHDAKIREDHRPNLLNRLLSTAIALSLLIVASLSFLQDRAIARSIEQTGGAGYSNECFSTVPRLLRRLFPDSQLIFADWGFHLQFLFLTKGAEPYKVRSASPEKWLIIEASNHEELIICAMPSKAKNICDAATSSSLFYYTYPIHGKSGDLLFVVIHVSKHSANTDRLARELQHLQ